MDLTPREIQEKQFHDAFRGYSHEEVDMFLDEVALSFERTYRENQEFHHRFKELEEQLHQARSTEDMLKKTLLTAQKTAEEAIEEAKQKAQGMVAGAERKALEIVANSERRAQEIVEHAVARQREIEVGLEGMKKFESEYRARLQAFIESQLRVLEEGPVAMSPQQETSPPEPQESRPVQPVAQESRPPQGEPPVVRPEPVAGQDGGPADEPTQAIQLGQHQHAGTPARPSPDRPGTHPQARPQERPKEDEDARSIQHLFWGEE